MFPLLLLGHLLGDFSLQTDEIAKNKHKTAYMYKHLRHHSFILILFIIVFAFVNGGKASLNEVLYKFFIMMIGIVVFHWIIDYSKCRLTREPSSLARNLLLFFVDQLLHVAVIVAACYLYDANAAHALWTATKSVILGNTVNLTAGNRLLTIFIMLIVVTKVSGVVVGIIVSSLQKRHAHPRGIENIVQQLHDFELQASDLSELKVTHIKENGENTDKESTKSEVTFIKLLEPEDSKGRLIGYLERLIIMALVIAGAYGAIGYVIAAKSFIRFKELDQRDRAEYILIGTLASTILGFVAGWISRAFIFP